MNCASVVDTSGVTASTPGGTPSPLASPLSTLLASGQAIQVAERDISAGNVAPEKQPTLPSDPTYTLSMDVYIEKVSTSLRNLIENTDINPEWLGNPATGSNAGTTRRPMVYVNGNGSWAPQNAICAEHFNSSNQQVGICTPAATTGSYFNFMMTVDNTAKKITTYINGVEKSNVVSGQSFTWAPTNNWILGNSSWGMKSSDGALKVKNVYLFPKVLSSTERSLLVTTSSPSTTSTFMNEPAFLPFENSGDLAPC
jgi:Concanavalin A-like lectin/glucanases superfamily